MGLARHWRTSPIFSFIFSKPVFPIWLKQVMR